MTVQYYFTDPSPFNDAISIENRYFTSDFSNRSYASLIFCIGITSTSAAAWRIHLACRTVAPSTQWLPISVARGCSGMPRSWW